MWLNHAPLGLAFLQGPLCRMIKSYDAKVSQPHTQTWNPTLPNRSTVQAVILGTAIHHQAVYKLYPMEWCNNSLSCVRSGAIIPYHLYGVMQWFCILSMEWCNNSVSCVEDTVSDISYVSHESYELSATRKENQDRLMIRLANDIVLSATYYSWGN